MIDSGSNIPTGTFKDQRLGKYGEFKKYPLQGLVTNQFGVFPDGYALAGSSLGKDGEVTRGVWRGWKVESLGSDPVEENDGHMLSRSFRSKMKN